MSKKIFVSHSHQDRNIAKTLADKLKDKGISTWLDEYELHPGEAWEVQIKDALIDCDAVLCVIGEGEPSPNVLVETGMALGQGKTVLPVVVSNNTDTTIFNHFSHFAPVNAFGASGIDNAVAEIAAAVRTLGDKA
ncbi:MAG: toll/interleukin-1 receptor domain-containing protein [Methylosarcina sp.]